MALTDEQKMQIIKEATAQGYKGSFQELFDQQEAAMAPEQSAQPMEQMPEQPMQPPMQTSDMPSMQQMQDGDLVQSYASAAPGVGNMPMGENVGNILESASTYKEGGFKGIKYADKYGTTYKQNPDVSFTTGLDDTYNISPRILKDALDLIDNKTIPSAAQAKLVGYEFFKDSVRKNNLNEKGVQEKLQSYSEGNKELLSALDTFIPASEKLSDEEYAGLRNEILGIYDTYKDFDSLSDIPAAYRAVKNQDLSGLKPYREKMGLSQQQLIDLIQVPEDAGRIERKAIEFVKREMAKKEFKHGGLHLPPLGSTPAMDMNAFINQELNNQTSSLDTNPAAQVMQGQQLTEDLVTEDKDLYKKTMAKIQDNNKKGIAPSSSDIALIKAGPEAQYNTKNIIAENTFEPQNRGEFRDTVKDQITAATANSIFAQTTAGGYGGDVVRNTLKDQQNFESNFANLKRGMGITTMQNVAMGVTGGGSGAFKYAPKLKNALKFNPSGSFGVAYNLPRQMIKNRSVFGGLSKYRSGLMGKSKLGTVGNVLKDAVGGIHTLAVPSYLKDVANVKEDALQGGLSATELVKVANPYLNLAVNTTKAVRDVQKGDYTTAGLRMGSTFVDKFLPKSLVAKALDPEQTKSLTTVGAKSLDLLRKGPSNLKKTGIISTDKE